MLHSLPSHLKQFFFASLIAFCRACLARFSHETILSCPSCQTATPQSTHLFSFTTFARLSNRRNSESLVSQERPLRSSGQGHHPRIGIHCPERPAALLWFSHPKLLQEAVCYFLQRWYIPNLLQFTVRFIR